MKKVFYHCSVILILFFTGNPWSYSQISQPGTPPSFNRVMLKTDIPVEIMPHVDVRKLMNEDLIFDTIKDIPWRFGDNIQVNINPSNSGVWEYFDNQDKLWRTSVYSSGAFSINLTFNKYLLPPDAQLYIYNSEKTMVLGAFTDFNNQDDGYFATTLVHGDHIIIEYFEPANVAFAGKLQIETVTHAYRNPYDYTKSFGQSGICNLNVACEQAEGWENQIRSVAMMVSGGNGFCTGALINNTETPGKPLFLTANHCNFNPGTVVLWFNWQSETCANPVTPPSYNSMSGTVSLARNAATDFHLLELMQDVPYEFNPYFAGWNRTLNATITDTIIGIHHPRGDIKKFSYANGGVQASEYGGTPGSGTTHWRIVWSGGTTTEPASSGSPIFDAQGLIIGQLHGGGAACGNTLPDYFGRLGISWTGGGTPSTRLSNWLDPNSTGEVVLNGYDPLEGEPWNPSDFAATAISGSEILLQWKPNLQNDLIILATNTQDIFGEPTGPYSLGDEITTGGTIIYMGSDSSFLHQNLPAGQQNFYKIWSYVPENKFSSGIESQATTLCVPITHFPFAEGFNQPLLPNCWLQEYESGLVEWQTGIGNNEGSPDSTYEGTRNVFLRTLEGTNPGDRTLLVSPVLNLSSWQNATLSFFYANPADQNQDTLKVLYRTQADSKWQILETLGSDQVSWTNVSIPLHELTDQMQIAFQGETNYGKGISVDAVEISAEAPDSIPTPVNLVANLNNNIAELSWEIENVPVKSFFDVEGINIYRNNQLIYRGTDPEQLSFTDHALPVGIYHYFVINRSTTGMLSDSSNIVEINIQATGTEFSLVLESNGSGNTFPAEGQYFFLPESVVFLEAIPDFGWSLSHWNIQSDSAGTFPFLNFVMDENKVIEAIFHINQYQVNVFAEPAMAALSLTGEGQYDHGTVANFSALAAPGFVFQYWKDGDSVISTKANISFNVTEDKSLTAYFISRTHTLALNANPTDAAILTGSGTFGVNSEVTIEALPNPGWIFQHWSIKVDDEQIIMSEDPVYTFLLTEDIEMTATFGSALPSLVILIEGMGTTHPEPGEYNRSFKEEITLTATPADMWEFVKWVVNGDSINTPQFILQIEENTTAKAIFGPTTTIREFENVRNLSVFPVPSSDKLYVTLPAGNWQMRVIGITGSIIQSHKLTTTSDQTQSMDISSLPAGVYFVVAEDTSTVLRGRFIVN